MAKAKKSYAKGESESSGETGPVVLEVKATSPSGAMVKVPGSDDAVLYQIGRTELDEVVVVVTP